MNKEAQAAAELAKRAELVDGLTGLYFHIIQTKRPDYSGRIVGTEGNCAIVQMASCIPEENNSLWLFPLEDLTTGRALFFRDWEAWRRKGQELAEAKRKRIEAAEQWLEENFPTAPPSTPKTPKNQKTRRRKS